MPSSLHTATEILNIKLSLVVGAASLSAIPPVNFELHLQSAVEMHLSLVHT